MLFVFALGGVAFFALTAGFVALCDRLREGGQ